jgi:diguanylate cyclase
MKRILVIEEETQLRSNLISMLALDGFEAVGAENGLAGLAQAEANLPDLILCNTVLSDLDGYALLLRLRHHEQLAVVPFVFVGALSDRAAVRRAMNLGADDYLSLPFTHEEIVASVQACLKKREMNHRSYLCQVQQAKITIDRMSHWDPLTQLPNRRYFLDQIREALAVAKPQQRSLVVLSLNIDDWRAIVMTFGHESGDGLLCAIAERLKCCGAVVGRLAESEFGLILQGAMQHQQVTYFVQQLQATLMEPYQINGHEVRIRASVGIAAYPQHSSQPEALLMQADTAMRWCQQRSQYQYRFYNPSMSAMEAEQHLLATELNRAIERDQLEVHYQPQVDITTGQVIGLEALLRWHHPQRGLISPKTFIPIAEDSGMIVPIGEWVLRTACRQYQAWKRLTSRPFGLSVNLSMRQLQQENLVEMVESILRETGMDARSLSLELTETSLMKQVSTSVYTLHQLKALGVGLSIDDFGTGYSSLTYLNKLPIDTLKIDHSFVSQLTVNRNAAVISNAIIEMAQRLDLNIVAEGVENRRQLEFLHGCGCYAVQGFFYSPPLKHAQVQALLLGKNFLPQTPKSMLVGARGKGSGR